MSISRGLGGTRSQFGHPVVHPVAQEMNKVIRRTQRDAVKVFSCHEAKYHKLAVPFLQRRLTVN